MVLQFFTADDWSVVSYPFLKFLKENRSVALHALKLSSEHFPNRFFIEREKRAFPKKLIGKEHNGMATFEKKY